MAKAMEKNHPHQRHFHLPFMAVAPRFRGMGLGSAILATTLKRADDAGVPAYFENSNAKNTRLYQRAGFVALKNIAPEGGSPAGHHVASGEHGKMSCSPVQVRRRQNEIPSPASREREGPMRRSRMGG